jgi:hypothetical protein
MTCRSHTPPRPRPFRAAVLCGLCGALAHCGLEEVELRPQPSEAVASDARDDTDGVAPAPDAGVRMASSGVDQSPFPAGSDDFGVTPPGLPEKGCRKIDFLFVVDNSASMLREQSSLASSFPGFISVVEETLAVTDFHIMVVDTDGWDGEAASGALDPCRDALGAGKRTGSDERACGVLGDDRYLSADQPDLEQTFTCLAQVGTFGSSREQPMDAMLLGVGAAQNEPGGCNAGFLRQDAVLVVTFITDEDDTRSSGSPAVWRQALIDAKAGNELALVVLGLIDDGDLDQPLAGGPCADLLGSLPGLGGPPALQSFVDSLAQGSLASVCAPDYSPFFARAVNVIDTACDEFVPPVIK